MKTCNSCQYTVESYVIDDADGYEYCHECHGELNYDREHQ